MSYKPLSQKIIKKRTEKPKSIYKTYTFSISFPGLCVAIIIGGMSLSSSFIFGILIGRGYHPEQQLSEVSQTFFSQNAICREQDEKKSVLKPEELQFMSELKQPYITFYKEKKTVPVLEQKKIILDSQNTVEQSVEQLHKKPLVQQEDDIEDQKKERIQQNKQLSNTAPNISDTMIYDFIFQVASFKKKVQADTLREQLEEKGFRTQLTTTKDKKGELLWYHIRALLRGIESDAILAHNTFTQLRLPNTKIISKEPTGKYR